MQQDSRPSIPPGGGGKEELRAAFLKPYLLRLRDERGEKAVHAMLASAGVPPFVLEDETAWISVAAATRVLRALADALGRETLATRGEWMTHPETLGSYVRMLRVSTDIADAYRYLTAHAEESTRIGTYELLEEGPARLTVEYRPRRDAESPQQDRLLCIARAAELASVPRLWGLGDARVRITTCLSDDQDRCTYEVRWDEPNPRRFFPLGVIAGAALFAALLALTGSWLAVAMGAVLGGIPGGVIAALIGRVRGERAARTLHRNRIAALERGLELRGQLSEASGDLAGSVLGGRYRILRRIGSGGIGSVFAAEHVALGSKVAVKVLRGAAARDAAEIARLRREARVQVSLEHPNVVRTLDLDQLPDGSIYVVMELLRGLSLAERLRARGPLGPGYAIPVFRQVCRGLAAAHQHGVVHRDLKPGNIFLCDDGTVKVLDFGMSKLAEAESLTQDGYTLGTPEYMSPEQCIGAPLDGRSDIYAFGVLMYEALAGEIPLVSRERRQLLRMHQRRMPEPLAERRPDLHIPEALDAAVMHCLAKSPDQRPPDASALERELAEIPLDGLVKEYPPGTPRRPPRSAALRG